MLSLMPFTPRSAIFYAIYPKLCYLLYHIPRSSAIFFLKVMLQYILLTPSYANSSYAMFSGQSGGRISGYCCICKQFLAICFLWFSAKRLKRFDKSHKNGNITLNWRCNTFLLKLIRRKKTFHYKVYIKSLINKTFFLKKVMLTKNCIKQLK